MRSHTARVLAALRAQLPCPHPVRVRMRHMKKDIGQCSLVERSKSGCSFEIVLCYKLGPTLEWHALVHEWAHAFAWTTEHPDLDDHGPLWGVAYAEVYRVAVRID
jgi:hypothetical protein